MYGAMDIHSGINGESCLHGGIYSVNPNLVKVDFSSNVNPLGISQLASDAIQENAVLLSSKYPDSECRALKRSLSVYLENELDDEWICIGNGATELIHRFAQTFVRNKVIIPFPTFCEYESASKRSGAEINFVSMNNLSLDSDVIIESAKNSDAIFLCNPNNPTGLTCETKLIKKVIESVDTSTKILVDESYIELADCGPNSHTMIDKIKEFKNLIILRSMTKSFGLAGLRLGYTICNPKLTRCLSRYQIPWNVNGLAQAAGIASLNDPNHLKLSRALIQKERAFLQGKIGKMQTFNPHTSNVNYFLISLENKNSIELRDMLLDQKGVLVRDCSTFRGMGLKYVRVAVKTRDENLCLLDALESIDN
jgi:threonine-phosphate decarboxylase